MEEEQNEQENFDPIKKEIDNLEDQIKKMEKDSKEFFDDLQLSPHELEAFFNDRSRFTEKTFNEIQKKRDALSSILDRRLEEARLKVKKKSPKNDAIGGHWIFVR